MPKLADSPEKLIFNIEKNSFSATKRLVAIKSWQVALQYIFLFQHTQKRFYFMTFIRTIQFYINYQIKVQLQTIAIEFTLHNLFMN